LLVKILNLLKIRVLDIIDEFIEMLWINCYG